MAKNVVVTVDDYLIRKDPEKYKKMLVSKEEEVEIVTKVENDTEKRELLNEIERLEGANVELQTEIKESKSRIKELEGKNFELQMKLKKFEKKKEK